MFDERSIQVLAYNLETLLAEKIETVISRNIANTRPRDFYDIYILHQMHAKSCNTDILQKAIGETATKRGSLSANHSYSQGNWLLEGHWGREWVEKACWHEQFFQLC